MSALHVAQINFVPVPVGLGATDIFRQWPSLVDVAEAVASSGTRVSVIQATTRPVHVVRNGIGYHFSDIRDADTVAIRGRRFASLIDDIKADVLHVHGLDFAEDAFAISQCLPHLPIVFQDHANRPPHWWRRAQWRRWYKAASGMVFTAPELAWPYTHAGLLDPSAQVFAIPESSCRFTRGSRARARAETGLYGDPCILWVGHLNAGKDPMTVLDGVAKAAAKLPGLKLWCVFGNAPLLPAVQRRIDRDPHLSGRVHLLGSVAHQRVELLMRAADLFVSGSRSESCGYALLEAMACGVTPVVTDIPSFRALAGDVGHLWPCGDATRLGEALVHAATHRASPECVRAHFDATLSFTAVGRQWADAYAQVLGSQPRSVR
ncbi:glycosyl transferase [Dyella lipolytica]|uniref:Glycosyltransferase family 4 protein n=1 Tax=Dyella lipolytica TaxID=1867835 RepID=A0ABW8IS51_9GAMM|nr:glycosyltransferase family 4 protein [Dyella lipolytica]GLQ47136.1 glycosyl transferase [Dyella lipolytica]